MSSSPVTAAAVASADYLLSIPNIAQDQGLLVTPGGTGQATSYTLVYDVYVPAGTAGSWLPFFQSDVTNSNDGDLFGRIEGSVYGIGIGGNYEGEAAVDAWNRIAFTVEIGETEATISKYINGELVGTQSSTSIDRYLIDKGTGFLIFTDEDGETSPALLSNFGYTEKALTAEQIAGIGGVNAEGIFVGALETEALAANGSEFRFADGSIEATIGDATLTPDNATFPVVTAEQAGIPAAPGPDYLLSIPAGTPEQTLRVLPGGEGEATSYSIAFDLYVPSESSSGWIPFLQTDPANGSDGDLFGKVNGDTFGIGIGGVYDGEAKLDAWNRIAFTIETKDGQVAISKYINGELVGTQTSTDADRYAIDKAEGFLIFTDEDGETSGVHLSNFAYVETALSEAQIKALGGPSADGIVPDVLVSDFEALNGSEFNFDDGSLDPTLGNGTLDLGTTGTTIETPAEAGVPVVTAPVGTEEPEPVLLRSIKDMLLTKDAETITINLDEQFSVDGLINFTVTTSDGSVVSATVEGSNLVLDVAALGRSDIQVSATDADGQVYVDNFRVRVAGENAYTIAVIPDTQSYCYAGERQETFNGMTQWLADNTDNLGLRFVTFVGDITDDNSVGQWTIAKEAITKLNGSVPYALLPGNHDQTGNAQDYNSLQSDFFPVDYLKEHSTLGGVYDQETGVSNNAWYIFEGADGTKWINLSLEFGARDDVLRWASEVLDAHTDCRAILTTHHYTNMGTRADNYSGPLYAEGTGKDYGMGASAENANDGEDMWQDFVSAHTNIKFVFSGHVFGDGAETIVSYNDAGEPVYQMLVNYQDGVSLENTGNGDASAGGNGGNGAIRLITIDPDNDTVYTETYLEAFDEYLTGSRGDPEPSRDGSGGGEGGSVEHPIQPVTFGTDTVGGAESGVIETPHFDPYNGLKIKPGFAPSEGGNTYGAYTLVYDVNLPSEGNGLTSLFQSDLNNITDGDLWLNFKGDHAVIGTNGQDEGFLPLDQYIRIVVTLEKTGVGYTMNKYVDGVLQGTQTVGGEYDISADGFLIFADDSGETPIATLSSFAFVEKALTADEVAALGGATATGPYSGTISGVNMVQFDFTDGTLSASHGSGTMSQTIGGSTTGVQLTGELREHEETITDTDLGGAPTVQFVAHAGDDETFAVGGKKFGQVRLDTDDTVDTLKQIVRTEWLNANGELIAVGDAANINLDAGIHHLTLRTTGSTGTTSADDVTVTITNKNTLLQETFDDGDADGWTLGGANWQVAGSVASRDVEVEGIAAAEGMLRAFDGASGITFFNEAGSTDWADYTFAATLTAEDQKGLGVVAYYQDENNYYRLAFDIADNVHTLVKVQDGVETVIAQEMGTTPFDRAFQVKLAISNGQLLATLDGEALFDGVVTDDAPLSGGSVGLYSEGQRQVFFDDIFVEKGTLVADAGKTIRLVDTDGDGFADVDLSGQASFGLDGTTKTWSINGELLAKGVDATVSLEVGTHLVRLDLDGKAGHDSDTVKVEIVAADNVLVLEDFSDGLAQDFTFIDEGELGKAAAWSVVDGKLQQTSDRYSRELGGVGDTAPTAQWNLNWSPLGDGVHALRKGTYALYEGAGSADWTNYSVEADFTAEGGRGVGLMLHYQDEDNYYKFELDNTTGLPQLFSLKDGIEQTLWQGPHRYDATGSNHIRADIVDGKVQVWLNGTALFTRPIEIHDTEKGTFGLYNWHAGDGVTYDNVQVVALDDATDPAAIMGSAYADKLNGTAGADIFAGLDGNDNLKGGNGLDRLLGGAGNDTLLAGSGNDVLRGADGKDKLEGGAGKDILWGGKHNDVLSGGKGADIFEFRMKEGRDTIEDFATARKAGGDHDIFELTGSRIDTFAELKSSGALFDGKHGAVLDLGHGDRVLFEGVKVAHLGANDFDFV
jgi:hypothetical protein